MRLANVSTPAPPAATVVPVLTPNSPVVPSAPFSPVGARVDLPPLAGLPGVPGPAQRAPCLLHLEGFQIITPGAAVGLGVRVGAVGPGEEGGKIPQSEGLVHCGAVHCHLPRAGYPELDRAAGGAPAVVLPAIPSAQQDILEAEDTRVEALRGGKRVGLQGPLRPAAAAGEVPSSGSIALPEEEQAAALPAGRAEGEGEDLEQLGLGWFPWRPRPRHGMVQTTKNGNEKRAVTGQRGPWRGRTGRHTMGQQQHTRG